MRIVCTICTDPITKDLAATPCGHTFHYTCLCQWVTPNKTCPTCREKCLLRNIVKLFIDSSDILSTDYDKFTSEELHEKLALQENLLMQKDKALEEVKISLKEVQADMQAWQAQYDSTHRKLKTEQATNSTLKKQLSVMKYECDHAKAVQKEAEKLRTELSTMKGINTVLRGSTEEVDDLLKNYTPSQLSTLVVAIKGDYDVLKQKKASLQKEKDRLAQENNYTRRELHSKESELKGCHEKLSIAESDVQHLEQENNNLRQKVEMLHKAIESPGSKHALRRMFESPMPLKQSTNSSQMDIGASPLLVCRTNSKNSEEKTGGTETSKLSDIGSKRGWNEPSGVLLPVNKLFKGVNSSENVASGFNGMGGQSHFLMPKPSKQSTATQAVFIPSKNLKFAPRKLSTKHQSKLCFRSK